MTKPTYIRTYERVLTILATTEWFQKVHLSDVVAEPEVDVL